MKSIKSGRIPLLKARTISGAKNVYRATDKTLSLPISFSRYSMIGLRLSTKKVGVMKTTHTIKSMISRIHDLKDEMVSSFIMFSQIISDMTGAFLSFHLDI
jgi:hypothetical protein